MGFRMRITLEECMRYDQQVTDVTIRPFPEHEQLSVTACLVGSKQDVINTPMVSALTPASARALAEALILAAAYVEGTIGR